LIFACVTLSSLNSALVQANDSAVETSAGGLIPRKEHSVSMEKEILFISPNVVRVEYEFLNTTKAPVSTEVAFPIPTLQFCDNKDYDRDFADFKAWVDGKPITIKKEIRAFVNEHDVTADLLKAGIDIVRFGDIDCYDFTDNDLGHLKPSILKRLVKIGALNAQYLPEWEVRIRYHWKQQFPPGMPVRIRHEYIPVTGFQQLHPQELLHWLTDGCLSNELKKHIVPDVKQNDKAHTPIFPTWWVSYILTTANTWKTPIKDFQLDVKGGDNDIATFCWHGPIERTGEAELRVHETDFVPTNNLKIYFIEDIQK